VPHTASGDLDAMSPATCVARWSGGHYGSPPPCMYALGEIMWQTSALIQDAPNHLHHILHHVLV
jgi:hypothetical protein